MLAIDSTNIRRRGVAGGALPTTARSRRIRRFFFADLVDFRPNCPTASNRRSIAPLSDGFRDDVGRIVTEYDGHIAFTKGDGLLAVLGHPHAHENDVHRAASAGLDITRYRWPT